MQINNPIINFVIQLMKEPRIDVLSAKQSNVQNRSQKSRSVAQVDFGECKPMSKEEHLELVINRINEMRIDLTADDDDYSNILYAFANDLGESGRKYVHQICQYWVGKNGQRYSYDDVNSAYDYRLSHGNGTSTIATFMAIAKDNGVDISMPPGRYPEGSTPPVHTDKPQYKTKEKTKPKDVRPPMIQAADYLSSSL